MSIFELLKEIILEKGIRTIWRAEKVLRESTILGPYFEDSRSELSEQEEESISERSISEDEDDPVSECSISEDDKPSQDNQTSDEQVKDPYGQRPDSVPPDVSDDEWNLCPLRIKKLYHSLSMYDLVIDIFSIRHLPRGLKLYTSKPQILEILKSPIQANVVAVVGPFNSGKTTIISWLSGRKLVSGTDVCTAGLSIVLPTELMEPNKGKSFKRETIFLDTAGTDVPCHETDLKDIRATEVFLREIVASMSSRIIYATSKFDRETQVAIASLRTTLLAQGHNDRCILHNYKDLKSLEELQYAINQVKQTYETREPIIDDDIPGTPGSDDLDEAAEEQEAQWEEIDKEGATMYTTPHYHHFFLMYNQTPTGQQHNNKVIAALQKILANDAFRFHNVSLLGKVLKYGCSTLERYVEGWDPKKVSLTIDEQKMMIVPKGIDSQTLRLAKFSFCETGILSEHFFDLEGNMYVNEKENTIVVKIKLAGFSQEDCTPDTFLFDWNDQSNVDLRIKMKKVKMNDMKILHKGYKQGTGVFRIRLPNRMQMEYPDQEELFRKLMVLTNGELTITLKLAKKPSKHSYSNFTK